MCVQCRETARRAARAADSRCVLRASSARKSAAVGCRDRAAPGPRRGGTTLRPRRSRSCPGRRLGGTEGDCSSGAAPGLPRCFDKKHGTVQSPIWDPALAVRKVQHRDAAAASTAFAQRGKRRRRTPVPPRAHRDARRDQHDAVRLARIPCTHTAHFASCPHRDWLLRNHAVLPLRARYAARG